MLNSQFSTGWEFRIEHWSDLVVLVVLTQQEDSSLEFSLKSKPFPGGESAHSQGTAAGVFLHRLRYREWRRIAGRLIRQQLSIHSSCRARLRSRRLRLPFVPRRSGT